LGPQGAYKENIQREIQKIKEYHTNTKPT
jgi:hypothetical protein